MHANTTIIKVIGTVIKVSEGVRILFRNIAMHIFYTAVFVDYK